MVVADDPHRVLGGFRTVEFVAQRRPHLGAQAVPVQEHDGQRGGAIAELGDRQGHTVVGDDGAAAGAHTPNHVGTSVPLDRLR